ncbi:hypothetical protein [Desulforamulus aquiferis]|uniref:HTH cro/C1-type domain-containing protein n=1 Tax=Desulforamulus aquiferis TaxID=1397668 RepID=A0AAW7ZJ72_9FIRM|nr:hypothetical protein [Desulforamulus aquiferis]MDO7789127.1 hypothetical protein [Desulforamulus aquiferis]
MPVDYKSYRPKEVIIDAAAAVAGVSNRQYLRYENEGAVPSDSVVNKLAKLFQAPQMLFEHFGSHNEIGWRYYCRPLNRIDRSMPAVCFKSSEEISEMVTAIKEMCRMMLNNRDLGKWGLNEQFDQCFLELIDVEQLLLEAKIIYAEQRGLPELEKRYREHDAKCLQNGYRIEKRRAPVAIEAGVQ